MSAMPPTTPYIYMRCPCADHAIPDHNNLNTDVDGEDEQTFDPRAPRSNFSLYPLEHLLFCEDCQQIRCPRCITEEIVTFYCPNCLFEVPSSNLRSEGNRCTRSCYQCPVCVGPLQAASLKPPSDESLAPEGQAASAGGPYALFCQYCNWSSTEIGIEFDRPSGLYSQLSRLNNGGSAKMTPKEVKERRKENPDAPPLPEQQLDHDLQFASLRTFYQEQLADADTSFGGVTMHDGLGFSSPAALSRIMSLYTGRGHLGRSKQGRADMMREASTSEQGLKMAQLDDSRAVKQLMRQGWGATTSAEQRETQLSAVRFQDELRPVPYLLRTKRSKRCPACRHIISKPENKVTSTRFKIRLVAKSYIPTITIRPMRPTAPPVPVTHRPAMTEEAPLTPLKPYQYIVTFKNPLFESLKVTLATPNTTPGRVASKVTVLCPMFEVGANTDIWDDALKDATQDGRSKEESAKHADVDKIWDRGRNWVSIVLEIVPGSLQRPAQKEDGNTGNVIDEGPLREDEDVLEIPMLVRMEWEADAHHDMGATPGKDKDGKEKRELAFWCVLGVGRIAHS